MTNTTVAFDSNVSGATVILDGRPIGETPTTTEVSNAAWDDPIVRVEAEGYRPYIGTLDKELKVANGLFGLLLWWPSLFWVWGPNGYQYFNLVEEQAAQ